MYRLGLVDMLVTHANMNGFGLTPLFGDRRGYMPPQLKTKLLELKPFCFSDRNSFSNGISIREVKKYNQYIAPYYS